MPKELKYNPELSFIRDDIKGNLFIDGQFAFGKQKDKLPYETLFRWMLTPNPQRAEKRRDTFSPEVIQNCKFLQSENNSSPSNNTIVWLGHSSFYIRMNGISILTAPVLYDLTPLLRRRHALPCAPHHFKNIDYILLSHGHRDHLDIPSLKTLQKQNPSVEILCPLGFKKMLTAIGFKKNQEAAWWQQYKVKELQITFLPAKHWNRRFIADYNTTLWEALQ